MFVYYTYKNDEPLKAYIGMTKYPIETGYKGSGKYLWSAFKKYGKRNFTRIDLGEFDNKEECHYWEGFYIKTQKTEAKFGGYNLSPKGGYGCPGDIISEETKRKIGKSNKGKQPCLGKTWILSEETKIKISQVQKGKTAWNKGKPFSQESKRKMSESHKGNKSHIGKICSEESKKKMSESHKGLKYPNRKPLSEENRKKLSESRKAYWQRKQQTF